MKSHPSWFFQADAELTRVVNAAVDKAGSAGTRRIQLNFVGLAMVAGFDRHDSCEAAQVALGALQDPPVHGGSKRSKFYRVVRDFLAECGAKLKERGFSPVPW